MAEKSEIEIKSAIIIGAGNVAWQLGNSLSANGITIAGVYNRNRDRGKALAHELGTVYAGGVAEFSSNADIIILAVSDDALKETLQSTGYLRSGILVHTAGSVSMDILSPYSGEYGVVYPLQTLTAGRKLNLRQVPFFLEANNQNVYNRLYSLVQRISDVVIPMNSENRKILHLAAVISSNFSNHLLGLSQRILDDHNIPFGLLKPLMEETISKAFDEGPVKSQTGPAIRGNLRVIEKHINMLKNYPEISETYRVLSDSISRRKRVRDNRD